MAAGVPEDVHDQLTGYIGGGVGRTYRTGHPLEVLAKAIRKIRYAGLDLSDLDVR